MQKEAVKDRSSHAAVLIVENVSYWYGAKRALDDVSFKVYPGRVTALLGPNGAGKSTLFSLITRLFDAPEGRIEICGKSAAELGAKALAPLGVVFQQPTLDLDLTVKQNLRYFAALRGLQRSDADKRMVAALEPYRFERLYGAWFGRVVAGDAKAAVRRSADRYVSWLDGDRRAEELGVARPPKG